MNLYSIDSFEQERILREHLGLTLSVYACVVASSFVLGAAFGDFTLAGIARFFVASMGYCALITQPVISLVALATK